MIVLIINIFIIMNEITKLEQLSCLKISEDKKQDFKESLRSALSLLKDVEKQHINDDERKILEEQEKKNIEFLLMQRQYLKNIEKQQELINKNDPPKSILLNDGYFHAPQVLKSKD